MRGSERNVHIALACTVLLVVSGLVAAQELESETADVETDATPALPVVGEPPAAAAGADDPCDPVTLRSWLYYHFGVRSYFSGAETAACRIGGHARRDRITDDTSDGTGGSLASKGARQM